MTQIKPNKPMSTDEARPSSIIWLTLIALITFGVWSYFAMLDEVTVGTGKVTPAAQEQVISSK